MLIRLHDNGVYQDAFCILAELLRQLPTSGVVYWLCVCERDTTVRATPRLAWGTVCERDTTARATPRLAWGTVPAGALALRYTNWLGSSLTKAGNSSE